MIYFTATHKQWVFACVCARARAISLASESACAPSNTDKPSCFVCSGWKGYSWWKDLHVSAILWTFSFCLWCLHNCVFSWERTKQNVEWILCKWNLSVIEQLDPQTWFLSYGWSCSIYFSIKYEIDIAMLCWRLCTCESLNVFSDRHSSFAEFWFTNLYICITIYLWRHLVVLSSS